ncbi:3-isopropylmalate dehydratase small subunit [Ramlibacter rhizophilus]|uniref:3-isopropylmalate dehydratase small subunit n=1 Tax=Ramlibacter rhizophilus TaxID=1781167 RepID=A0A4Z0BZA2_9BURK|nr:3-isopropylmalate dehydratase small subunit [Ramlibacter rhizophilus]TFZ04311.1 3-isopropylmalate dehydratase small subunit [Ramlibacter rhizophilus]
MQAFENLRSPVVPIDRANVDTDALIPKQFMKSIRRTGFGDNLFDEWRYLDRGEPGQDVSQRPRNPDFALNQPRYAGARILLARENFGCGSSREHAVWALRDFGIRVLIAPRFADIFFGNCFKNGLLPIVLDAATVERLFADVAANPGYAMAVDLAAQTLTPSQGEPLHFEVDPPRKHRLLEGLDDIGLTLQRADRIRAFEAQRRQAEPWLFN